VEGEDDRKGAKGVGWKEGAGVIYQSPIAGPE